MNNKLKTLLFILGLTFFACKREDNCPDLDNSRINTENSRIGLYFRDSLGNNINHLVFLEYHWDTLKVDTLKKYIVKIDQPFLVSYLTRKDTSDVNFTNPERYICYGKDADSYPIDYFDSIYLNLKTFTNNQTVISDTLVKENGLNVFIFNIKLI